MSTKNGYHLAIGLICVIIVAFFTIFIRPYLSGFFIDTMPNILGVPAAFFLIAYFNNVHFKSFANSVVAILSVGLGFIIYEFVQYILPINTFDTYDIYATLLGVILTIILNSFGFRYKLK